MERDTFDYQAWHKSFDYKLWLTSSVVFAAVIAAITIASCLVIYFSGESFHFEFLSFICLSGVSIFLISTSLGYWRARETYKKILTGWTPLDPKILDGPLSRPLGKFLAGIMLKFIARNNKDNVNKTTELD